MLPDRVSQTDTGQLPEASDSVISKPPKLLNFSYPFYLEFLKQLDELLEEQVVNTPSSEGNPFEPTD